MRIQFRPDEFVKFVESPLPEGLETSLGTLRKFCAEANDLLDAFDRLTQRPHG